ncbi:hypothetical protein FVR03_18850 [Pontibacter qinzhouensis]|uniref:Uncharacterized protein n=1 Tax=Pontibacter qinzhouensis TaxID=2603253 RepID=A0A5C8J9X3_9BACT|nr:hypothetical protein [Pontibacter qinzhouensis]TXK33763.1 hypothetical protein FVR03_18850 [Pontibacter qinzhouensis]
MKTKLLTDFSVDKENKTISVKDGLQRRVCDGAGEPEPAAKRKIEESAQQTGDGLEAVHFQTATIFMGDRQHIPSIMLFFHTFRDFKEKRDSYTV